MSTILVTGIGGLTPRSIATTIKRNHPDYKLIGIDINKKAIGFFMKGLLDEHYVCPRCTSDEYFPWIERLVRERNIDYAFVQPESEIVEWGDYCDRHGKYPCPVFMGCKKLSVSLKDKSIMAELLKDTEFIPKTIKVTQENPRYKEVGEEIGFPCWIRATNGTGGLGSLKLEDMSSYRSWLFINSSIPEFTVSEFLTGRHLANEMLYYNGEYVKGAALECAEYVMASTAPSHVTGNTAYGRFLNEDRINEFCDKCIKYLESKLDVKAHGILSFDLKEDSRGELKVTEVNIRHMAYTGVMAQAGFDLIEDTIRIMEDGNADGIMRTPYYHYDKPYVFLRDVDIEPMLLESEDVFNRREY
ncbi:hypothetical protein [uncultured Bacteroides sp.]|uniref:ATP-binding protein n=1 Tax=uncultured Bacteroides sp. TaxID=162156 RepID=UPI00263225D9|nr:hypothetical protein [uncultured Bacteroides sp.]